MVRLFVVCGSALCFLGVAVGAFAAHALKDRLQPDLFAAFEVGVRYHIYHALGLFALAWLMTQFPHPQLHFAGWLFLVGIVLFSGSLYLLSVTGVRWLGAITPVGGVCFLVGWLWVAWCVVKSAG